MKYLKVWTGFDPKKEKPITRTRIIEDVKDLLHEIETQKDEVFYSLTKENVNDLKITVMKEIERIEEEKRKQMIDEIDSKIEGLVKHKEYILNKKTY